MAIVLAAILSFFSFSLFCFVVVLCSFAQSASFIRPHSLKLV